MLVLLCGNFFSVRAELQVDITRGNAKPLPIAIPVFFGKTAQEIEFGRDVADLISSDLERSGRFFPIDRHAYIQKVGALKVRPRFGDWRQINAHALVTGVTQAQRDGRLRVEFRLWDVFGQTQMTGLAYFTAPRNWRRVAHIIADEIYKRMTGESGYFDTRIVYVSEGKPSKNSKWKKSKQLVIMDQDGANPRPLTDKGTYVLTPRFSPTEQQITYLAYNQRWRVYVYNIYTGKRTVIGDWPGMSFAPRFSPDGNSVIMSLAKYGNTDIYTMDLRTQRKRRLTRNPSIDTSPSYAPDGRRIVFNSDRGGKEHLYVMNANGTRVHRISRGKGRYSTPVWSPRGDLIAFTKAHKKEFFIGVMQPDGTHERILTGSWHVEGPTWAPNGRVLMYTKRVGSNPGTNRLFSIDLTGYNERLIATKSCSRAKKELLCGASDPAWSPLGK
ncbi:MAG: Tol-Pal system beta propeller repeat protein TolB [Pseudomonadota bacterium]|nr:Tol-Pal system beta propeller repeat protein TolB [Pseudomonadota bacterium]